MELKIKILKWSAGIPVVMLNEKTAKKIGIFTKDRVFMKTNSNKTISSIVDITEGSGLVGENEIAVTSELKDALELKVGQKVDVTPAPISKSLIYIKKKLDKKELSETEIRTIIDSIVSNSLSEAEIALFVSAMYRNGTSMNETISLVKAIAESGKKIIWKKGTIVDKHSIGGIPGNRTTPLVVSICASAGLLIPKTSSRAITTAAGTSDVVETIADVEFSIPEIKKIVSKTNGCMVWGGSLGIVPADSKIIKIEKVLEVDPEAQLLASIMAKKLSMGARYILIDIPYGKTAKVSKERGLKLKKKFEYLGKYFKRNLKVVLTNGEQPIGNGIGPALELIDIVKILKRDKSENNIKYPYDLEKKSVFLAGELLEMTGTAKKGKGEALAMLILESGKAFEKFKEIIKAQRGSINRLRYGKFKKIIPSYRSGTIAEIHNKKINSLTRATGCPLNKFSGVYLHHHLGEKVKKGEPLITLYSDIPSKLKEAVSYYKEHKPISIR